MSVSKKLKSEGADMKQLWSEQDMLLVGKGYEIQATLRRLMMRDGAQAPLATTLHKQKRIHNRNRTN
ncbi:hypothetical protein [Paenibacillus sp. 481]|uniref:hypothetical protein n=1 Tax=Paenibacillus sp. 481 TaxID=2835869 RepID=UPI001E38BF1C|nr:hypothetical protein [Paenibacillus sp. 481]UHA72903.1 hypothetical protein KIK04_20120 [Paenibacillus sp. 481]